MPLTIQFQFVSDEVASGYRCELYHGAPYKDRELEGKIEPLQTVALDGSLTAKFTKNPGNGYALRLLDPKGKVFARTNTRALNAPSKLLVVDPVDFMVIPEKEFASNVPKLPLKLDDKTVFDKLVLGFVGDHMQVAGHGTHDGVFNTKFNFDFRFKVNPIQIPVWTPVDQLPEKGIPEDTLELKETSLKINADKGGHAGVLGTLRPLIRLKFRRGLQKKFHESILKRVGGADVHRVFTLRKSEVVDDEWQLTHTILEDSPA
jgi:hypothetical protein